MATSDGALKADSLLDYMVKSIPTPPPDSPQQALIKDAFAAIALFSHACMLAVGFRLIGLGEEHKLGMCNRAEPPSTAEIANTTQRHSPNLKTYNHYLVNGMPPLPMPSVTLILSLLWNSSSR